MFNYDEMAEASKPKTKSIVSNMQKKLKVRAVIRWALAVANRWTKRRRITWSSCALFGAFWSWSGKKLGREGWAQGKTFGGFVSSGSLTQWDNTVISLLLCIEFCNSYIIEKIQFILQNHRFERNSSIMYRDHVNKIETFSPTVRSSAFFNNSWEGFPLRTKSLPQAPSVKCST